MFTSMIKRNAKNGTRACAHLSSHAKQSGRQKISESVRKEVKKREK